MAFSLLILFPLGDAGTVGAVGVRHWVEFHPSQGISGDQYSLLFFHSIIMSGVAGGSWASRCSLVFIRSVITSAAWPMVHGHLSVFLVLRLTAWRVPAVG